MTKTTTTTTKRSCVGGGGGNAINDNNLSPLLDNMNRKVTTKNVNLHCNHVHKRSNLQGGVRTQQATTMKQRQQLLVRMFLFLLSCCSILTGITLLKHNTTQFSLLERSINQKISSHRMMNATSLFIPGFSLSGEKSGRIQRMIDHHSYLSIAKKYRSSNNNNNNNHHHMMKGETTMIDPEVVYNALLPNERTVYVSSIQQQQQHQQNGTRSNTSTSVTTGGVRIPLLNELIHQQNDTIMGDVNFLLQFAILGFGKCGTSTMMQWLSQNPSDNIIYNHKNHNKQEQQQQQKQKIMIRIFPREVNELLANRPSQLVRMLYDDYNNNRKGTYNTIRGYKSPNEITQVHVLKYYKTLFPTTKMIIGIRHPIYYFESLYNFRIQNSVGIGTNVSLSRVVLQPQQLIGPCVKGMQNICTEKANFAYYLIRLGKQYVQQRPNDGYNKTGYTQLNDQDNNNKRLQLERKIVNHYPMSAYKLSKIEAIPNPIFLYDVNQLQDTNLTRLSIFRNDLQNYLGLSSSSLPTGESESQDDTPYLSLPIPHERPGIPYKKSIQEQIDSYKIHICDEQHTELRQELLILAQDTSQWLRLYFLNAPDVHVSSKEYLEKTILGSYWMKDPCEKLDDPYHHHKKVASVSATATESRTISYHGPMIRTRIMK